MAMGSRRAQKHFSGSMLTRAPMSSRWRAAGRRRGPGRPEHLRGPSNGCLAPWRPRQSRCRKADARLRPTTLPLSTPLVKVVFRSTRKKWGLLPMRSAGNSRPLLRHLYTAAKTRLRSARTTSRQQLAELFALMV